MKKTHNRICLIGMSGIGKSSLGKKIAKHYNIPFIDTDTYIQSQINQSLKDYINQFGEPHFLKTEESLVSTMPLEKKMVIATGGSVVYSQKTMSYLKKNSVIIYLNDTFENIQKRIKDYDNRGIIMNQKSSLQDVFTEREPLYQSWADIVITYPIPFSIKKILNTLYKQINFL